MKQGFSLTGLLADLHQQRIYPARLTVVEGKIEHIEELDALPPGAAVQYLLPGFTDAHVHIESSMLIPSQFARLAVVHGTVATVSDPHEIANVCGLEGIDYMIADSRRVPFKFNFGAPSCVPATSFETAGAMLDAAAVEGMMQREEIGYLSEVMNFPGVLAGDTDLLQKIAAAARAGKPVDGHAPGLRGEAVQQYIDAGISTDHECFTEEEARDKLERGMKVLIREGSAARNFDALILLLKEYPDSIMFCSDDKHPDSLVEGHINGLCARAVAAGVDLFAVLKAACLNPVLHYRMPVGLLRQGDPADFILVHDLQSFNVIATYINGMEVAREGKSKMLPSGQPLPPVNRFACSEKSVSDFFVPASGAGKVAVIEALDGQLITNRLEVTMVPQEGGLHTDTANDLLKIVVVNRYEDAKVATAFIRNFGLKRGALASSVAHDSHNVVAVGADDESLCRAVNALIRCRGGVSCIDGERELVVPLPVAGLMSEEDGYAVAEQYSQIDQAAKALGSSLGAPYMTLSFMALLVIPHLKLSDKGLFDGSTFRLLDSIDVS
jgi:adenine deaminase